jgi:hypothetical protein
MAIIVNRDTSGIVHIVNLFNMNNSPLAQGIDYSAPGMIFIFSGH